MAFFPIKNRSFLVTKNDAAIDSIVLESDFGNSYTSEWNNFMTYINNNASLVLPGVNNPWLAEYLSKHPR